jgi:hypothetical protein
MHGLCDRLSVRKVIVIKDVEAKAEFLGQRADNTVKADCQYYYLATFWQKGG